MGINDVIIQFFMLEPPQMIISSIFILLAMLISGIVIESFFTMIGVLCRGYDPNKKDGGDDA